jgi:hypothetical protein
LATELGEDVRPLLLQQARLVAGALGLLVDDARLLALLDLADDDALADHHLHGVDALASGSG